MKKQYSAAFKSKVALEAIRGQQTLSELASRHGIHRLLIQNWKKKMLEFLPGCFTDKKKKASEGQEELINSLYQEIGKLKVEKDWLKKKYESFNG